MFSKQLKNRTYSYLLPVLALLILLLAACTQDANAAANGVDDTPGAFVETAVSTPTDIVPLLSDAERADLLFMREEEKLARDVYLALYEQHGLKIFQNIAASEQTHTNAILNLLDTYGLADPVGANPPGEFVNQDLQALYDQLVATGSQSLVEALRVGTAIEEIDILDLDEAIARTTHADILQVYQRLEAGSENHLRAFIRVLERQTGEAYQPQYLEPAAYKAIVNSSSSQGSGRGSGGSGQSNGRNQGRGRGANN